MIDSRVKLRPMNHEEYLRYSRFGYENFINDASAASGEPVESVRARVGEAPAQASPDDCMYVIECAEEDIGYIWIKIPPQSEDAFGYDIYLEPHFRGKGLGRQVMLQGRKILQERRVKKLKICVFSENTPARTLYESLGFKETEFKAEKRQCQMEIDV